jgi:hypothetical protein
MSVDIMSGFISANADNLQESFKNVGGAFKLVEISSLCSISLTGGSGKSQASF